MIYVDEFPAGWGKWTGGGHMLTTDIDELHEMAHRLKLRRDWFQDKRIPHYDLQKRKRALAIRFGAVEIGLGELPNDIIMLHPSGKYIQRSVWLAHRNLPKDNIFRKI